MEHKRGNRRPNSVFQGIDNLFQKRNLRNKSKLANNYMLHLMGNYDMLEEFREEKKEEE